MENERAGGEKGLPLSSRCPALAPASLSPETPSTGKPQAVVLLSGARDQTLILMDTGQILNPLSFSENFLIIFLFFLGPHLWHMEVPRLGVKSELQLQVNITATAMPGP